MSLVILSGCQIVVETPSRRASFDVSYAAPHRQSSAEKSPAFHQVVPASHDESIEPDNTSAARHLAAPLQLTLDAAVQTSLAHNPDLVAARHDEDVSRAALEVARTYPYNPTAALQFVPTPIEDNGDSAKTGTQVSVMQTFELAQQSRYRERTGVARLTGTQWTIAQAEILNIAETERRFFTALYLRQLHGIAESAAGLNEKLQGVLVRRLKAGTASAADVALAKIEASSSRQQADLARARFAAALVNLQTHLG